MKFKLFLFSVFVILLIALNSFRPVSPIKISQQFVINRGESLQSIAARLEANGLIRHRYSFIFLSYFYGLNRRLQAGNFNLSPSLSSSKIILSLSRGGSHDYWLKIVAGSRLEELDFSLPDAYEGYLFPDNYLIPEEFTSAKILQVINKNFDQKFNQAKTDTTTSFSDAEIVILASLLEREARLLPTKQMIAGIIINRLEISMPLQIDATAQYARDSLRKPAKYWLPVSSTDLKVKSVFNTYLNPGLPPAPICNPGYDSLYAAFHPTPSDYLFYITDTNGQIHYAKTLTEHNQNIAKYLN